MIGRILRDQMQELRERLNKTSTVVEREMLRECKDMIKSKLIKVIIGPRRAGKSFFAYLLLKNKVFAYANFDEKKLIREDEERIIEAFYEVYGKDLKYVLLDEIQNLENWELFVNKLHRKMLNLFITGSNSKLLSRELATALTGRHIVIEILPFSFREYLRAINFSEDIETTRGLGILKRELKRFMETTGFPEVVVEHENARYYVRQLFDDIVTRDIVLRYKIRNEETVRDIAETLVSNISCCFTYNRIKRDFGLGSEHTAKNYIRYMNETYTVLPLSRFSFKPREVKKSEKKAYTVDNGFYNFVGIKHSENIGRLYENTVAIELMHKGLQFDREVFYYRSVEGYEVDFLIKNGNKVKQLIQVCYNIEDETTRKREIRALIHASKQLNCKNLLVITEDYENEERVRWFGTERRIKFILMVEVSFITNYL